MLSLRLKNCVTKINYLILRRNLKTLDKLEENLAKIRNIGVIAHIDAGKTTTTERMLYYSGFTHALGNVDDGNTVMDYMDQERERGITITSAAITFSWKNFQLNLIDTPGHVDFTIEVERALRVLDGAVAIFDASAGVEAQSLTVWRQATRYSVPRIAYINKMDKFGADYYKSIASIEKYLNTIAIPIQIPVGKEKTFTGIIDLINMNKLCWNEASVSDGGKTYSVSKLSENDEQFGQALKYRFRMIEKLAQADDKLAEILLDKYNLKYELVDDNILLETYLRKLTISSLVTPIFCGSSFKNIAVQPLLDAIIKYLPSPEEREYPFQKYYGNNLCALCFKTIHDHKKMNKIKLNPTISNESGDEILTFVRIYNGELSSKSKIFNSTKNLKEECTKIFIPYADQMKSVSSIKSGNIAVISGLKHTITGDTLVLNENAYKSAISMVKKENITLDIQKLQAGLEIPPPVYFCSIEVNSQMEETRLIYALKCLQREDPTLRVEMTDENSGQTIIQGMGELHLDIIKERIKKEYGLDVYFGPLEIAYKESPTVHVQESLHLERVINSRKNSVEIELVLIPKNDHVFKSVTLIRTQENLFLADVTDDQLKSINHGINSALSSGSLLRFPVVNTDVHLTKLVCNRNTLNSFVSTASNNCIKNALKKASSIILQPIMNMEITTQSEYAAKVQQDLIKRNSFEIRMNLTGQTAVINAKTPLAHLRTYSSDLRRITSGHTTFSFEYNSYDHMSQKEYQELYDKIYKK